MTILENGMITHDKRNEVCRIKLTDDDIKALHNELETETHELMCLGDEKKSVMADLKARIDARKTAIEVTVRTLREGYKDTTIMCDVVYNYDKGTVEFYDENGALVKERVMKQEERTVRLI